MRLTTRSLGEAGGGDSMSAATTSSPSAARRIARAVMGLAAACFLTLSSPTGAGAQMGRDRGDHGRGVDAPRVTVSIRAGRLSIDTRDASLVEVAREVARVSGVAISLEGNVERAAKQDTVTVRLDDVEVADALNRLFRGRNCVFVYAPAGLVEARIYTDGSGPMRPVAAPAPKPGALPLPLPVSPKSKPDRVSAGEDSPRLELATIEREALTGVTRESRMKALEDLSMISDEFIVSKTVITVLERDRDSEVLGTALEVLGQQSTPPLEPALDLLARTRDAATRIRALDYLEEHGKDDPRVRAAVARVARTDRREEVQGNATLLLDTLDAQ